jgi:hypothetical protein
MPLPDDLLELARDLTDLYHDRPRQATLRRAVSTAYYALFHLLISEATLNWSRSELRPVLGRLFEHGVMRSASEALVSDLTKYLNAKPPDSEERSISEHLHKVATTFMEVQRSRQNADYNTAVNWTVQDVEDEIGKVAEAFERWQIIRETPAAQAYLLALLGSKGQRR